MATPAVTCSFVMISRTAALSAALSPVLAARALAVGALSARAVDTAGPYWASMAWSRGP